MYIDSPVWRREQIETGAATARGRGSPQASKDIIAEAGKGKWDKEVKASENEHQQKSDYKNFSDETIELQASALYRIAGATKNGARNKNEIV